MVSFTGSTRAGVLVAQNAAPTVKRVAQELGGKSANIMLDDADFEKAVTAGASEHVREYRSVLRCTLTHAGAARADGRGGRDRGTRRHGNPGRQPARRRRRGRSGRVRIQQWHKIQDLIQKGIDEGATLAAGGTGRPDGLDKGYYVKPTVFADVSNDMTIAREEIFGPVLSIIPYDNEDDAVRIANDTPYGLSGYVSSSDLQKARRVASRMRTGMVHINGAWLDSAAPFGGFKQSGNGREWGAHGMDEFLEIKSVYGFDERKKK